MRLITPPLLVEDSDGFKNDIFQRESFGNSLLGLIKHSDDGLVISLDSQWGEGKTTFIKMWQRVLKQENIANIYIDAFKSDYDNDAFITIASAIIAYTEEHCRAEKAGFLEIAKKVGVKLLPIVGKIALKAATLNLIDKSDIEDLKTIKDDVATGTSDAAEKMIEERLNPQTKDIALVEKFKTKLGELAKKTSEQGDGKLVIIIDELDRCRPSFAVEILEKIKHFFSVPNVFFVLVMHKKQLECAVKHIYGDEIDAHTYLQKFIHVETSLPKRNDDFRRHSDVRTYVEQLFELHGLNKIYLNRDKNRQHEKKFFITNLELFAQHFKLSLRELEKVFTNLVIIHTGIENVKDTTKNIFLATFVSIVKVKHPETLNKLQLKNISYEELDKQLNISAIQFDANNEYSLTIIKDMLLINRKSNFVEDYSALLSEVIEALSLFKVS